MDGKERLIFCLPLIAVGFCSGKFSTTFQLARNGMKGRRHGFSRMSAGKLKITPSLFSPSLISVNRGYFAAENNG